MLGKNIANLRKEKHMTQEELAIKLNLSRQAISKWESGITEPDVNTLMLLSEIFEVSIDELVKGKNVKEESKQEDTVIETNKKVKRILIILMILIGIFVLPLYFDNIGNNVNDVIGNIDEELTGDGQVKKSSINNQLKIFEHIYSVNFDIDILSYKKQTMLFSGTISAWDFLDNGTITLNFRDDTEENISLTGIGNGLFSFSKVISAKDIKSMEIQFGNKIAVIKPILFNIIDYMYGLSSQRTHYSISDTDYVVNPNFIWSRDEEGLTFFDLCISIEDKASYDEEYNPSPLTCKIYENDKMIKELTVDAQSIYEYKMIIEEKYSHDSEYRIDIEYYTPLGHKLECSI